MVYFPSVSDLNRRIIQDSYTALIKQMHLIHTSNVTSKKSTLQMKGMKDTDKKFYACLKKFQ